MRFNKNPFEYLVNHKVLHKIGKQWATISIGALMLFSGTSFATHVNADQVQNNSQVDTNKVVNNQGNQADTNSSTSTINQNINSNADAKVNNSEVSQQSDQALAQSATSSVNNVNVKPQQSTQNTNSDSNTKTTDLNSDNSASSNQQQSTNHLPVPNTLTSQAKSLHTKLLNNALADALQDNKDANKPVSKSTETSSKHSSNKALKKGHKYSKYSKYGKTNKAKYHHHYKYNKKYRKYHTLKNHKRTKKYAKHSKYAYKNKKKYTKYGKRYGRKATKAHKKYGHKYYLTHKKNKKRAVRAHKKVTHRKHKKHIYHYKKHASVRYNRKNHEKYVQGAMLVSDSNEANHSDNGIVSSQANVTHSPNSDANVEWLNTDDDDHQYAIPDEDLSYFQNDNSDSYADHLVDLGRITPSKVRVNNQTNVNGTNFDNIYYPEADSNYWVTANSVSHNKNSIYNLSDFANFLSSEENKFLNSHFNSADIAQIQNVRNRYNYLMTNENQSDGDTNPADFRQHMVDWINFYRTYVYKESPVNEDASFDATAQHSANIQSDPEDMDWGDVKPSEILKDYITDAADIDNDGETDHRDSVLRTSNGLVGVGQSGKVNALFFNFGMGNGSVNDPQNIDYPKVSDFPLSLAQKGEFWSVQSPALSGSVSVDVEDLTEHQSLPVSHITVGSNEVYFKVDPSYLYTGHDYRIYVNCPNFNSPYWYDTSFYNL